MGQTLIAEPAAAGAAILVFAGVNFFGGGPGSLAFLFGGTSRCCTMIFRVMNNVVWR
jgi:hypothetical protein